MGFSLEEVPSCLQVNNEVNSVQSKMIIFHWYFKTVCNLPTHTTGGLRHKAPNSLNATFNNNNNNNNNNIYLFTAIGLLPSGSGYFTCKQNMKLVTARFKSGGLHEKHVVAFPPLT